jgi:capsular polysaccharide biosynthesis protein
VDVVEQPDDEMWLFSSLYYVTPVHRPPLFKFPTSLHRLRSVFLPRAISESATRRFFIQRGSDPRRPLENEREVLTICQFFNIQPVRPELLSIKQQILLFNSADMIMGVKGAALANIIFCRADTKIIVLSPNDFADPFFWDIAGQLSLQYFEVFGPISSSVAGQAQNPFSIDTDDLTKALLYATRDRKLTISGWQRSA